MNVRSVAHSLISMACALTIVMALPLSATKNRPEDSHAIPAVLSVEHRVVSFWRDGVQLKGSVFKPSGLTAEQKLPGILMVHGWGGNRANLNRAYAAQFAELGFVVMTFDVRGWGESDGFFLASDTAATAGGITSEPSSGAQMLVREIREVVDPLEMLHDTHAALAWFTAEPNLQADNLGIWGTSLGGALAIVTAARNSRINAIVTQVGAVNSKANFAMIPDDMVEVWESQRARGEIPPYPGPESALPGLRGYPDLIAMKRFDPAAEWQSVNVPTLIIDAEDEELFDRKVNGDALYRALQGRVPTEYLVLPGTHYSLYKEAGYSAALQAAQAWFVRHLQ
ncbi:MAG: alpha/beta fold hydrolase [Haliea sp.]|nr:alpha/beta fold hydrolase [Haliea sp.]